MTIPTIETIGTPAGVAWGVAVLLVLCLSLGWRQARGTTLGAPIVWALFATAALALDAVVESLAANSEYGIGLSALRFAAAAVSLCPLMAILGAKRPQNRGWQWVVLTLWIVLVWPAAQAVLMPTGLRVELFVVWKLFLLGLVAISLLNYLPTRNCLAACVFAAGQLVLFDNYLWRWGLVDLQWALAVGLACFLAAALIVCVGNQIKCKKVESKSGSGLAELDQRWLDFRDAFGALWALRILVRVNQTAEISQWPLRLAWSGFVASDGKSGQEPTAEQLAQLQATMATLLRRFV